MRLRSIRLTVADIFSLFITGIALLASPRSHAAQQSSDVPAWLNAHVGEGEDQISQVVLRRARALYLQKLSEGAVKNPCCFAMDATRPNDLSDAGRRFYVICESARTERPPVTCARSNGYGVDAIPSTAPQAPSRESGFVHWPNPDENTCLTEYRCPRPSSKSGKQSSTQLMGSTLGRKTWCRAVRQDDCL
jgi:hypothetical protein